MYYLLGFRIVRMCQATVDAALEQGKINELLGWEDGAKVAVGTVGRSHIFQAFDEQVLRKVLHSLFFWYIYICTFFFNGLIKMVNITNLTY